jgi:hypothetical protein
MSPAQFVEFLIIGMNLFLLFTFLAWRFLGPGKPNCLEHEIATVANKNVPAEE